MKEPMPEKTFSLAFLGWSVRQSAVAVTTITVISIFGLLIRGFFIMREMENQVDINKANEDTHIMMNVNHTEDMISLADRHNSDFHVIGLRVNSLETGALTRDLTIAALSKDIEDIKESSDKEFEEVKQLMNQNVDTILRAMESGRSR